MRDSPLALRERLWRTLPGQLARTHQAWWTLGANVEGAPHADAWMLAGRTATPNLQSRIVIFQRTSTARPGLRSS